MTQEKITEYKHILTMIESVNPDNRDMCDEINLRVIKALVSEKGRAKLNHELEIGCVVSDYTHSLDAIVGIQEDGWLYKAYNKPNNNHRCVLNRGIGLEHKEVGTPSLPTEPLARLHAVIQTKIWELENE